MKNLIQNIFRRFSWKYLIFAGVLIGGSVFADTENSDVIKGIIDILNLFFLALTTLLTPAIILAGWLLSPDWTMGDFFGLRPYFINMWVLVSNLVYIIFAMMLLWMAIMQIFSSESPYAFKKKLPRFLVGILIVPFTWLIVSWTLSFANQAVAAVLSIPMGAISSITSDDTTTTAANSEKSLFHKRVIPTTFNVSFGDDSQPENTSCTSNGKTSSGVKCISPAEFITYNQSGPFFIILIYAYDIFKVQSTDLMSFNTNCTTDTAAKDCIKSLAQIARKIGVSLITTVFFFIILVALCWVLLARAFKLWIYVMFSPLFGLAYAVSDEGLGKSFESSGGGGHGGGLELGEVGFVAFFKLAMVPVLVSAVLAFGLLFIGVMRNTFSSDTLVKDGSSYCTDGDYTVKYCATPTNSSSTEGGYTSKLIIGSDTTNSNANGGSGDYTITFNFGSWMSELQTATGTSGTTGTISAGIDGAKDIFAHIIISLIALAVMWTGVKAAVSHDAITKAAFEPFAKFGESVGNFVQHIPSYLPTPHPAFQALTPGGMTAMANALNQKVNTEKAEQAKSMAEILSDPSLMKFSSDLAAAGDDVKKHADIIREAGEKIGTLNGFKDSQPKLVGAIDALKNATFDSQNSERNRNLQDQAGKLAIQLENAKDLAAVQKILSDNTELVAEIKRIDPGGAGDIINSFQKASGASVSNNSSAFTPTIIKSTGKISGDNTIETVTFNNGTATISGNFTPAQIEAIRSKKSSLSSPDVSVQKKALGELGFTVDDSEVNSFARGLITKAGV